MNPFLLLVSPETVLGKVDKAAVLVGRVHRTFTSPDETSTVEKEVLWEIPGIGTVVRQQVMDTFGLLRPHLHRLVTKANHGHLPLIWLGLLQLLVQHPDKVAIASQGPTLSALEMKLLRERYQLSQVDMSHLTGYSSVSIGRWESVSARIPPVRSYNILCQLLKEDPQTAFAALLDQAERMTGFNQQRLRSLRVRLTGSGGLKI